MKPKSQEARSAFDSDRHVSVYADIKELRRNLKLNQTAFGRLIGRSRPTIRSYEAGASVPDEVLLACANLASHHGLDKERRGLLDKLARRTALHLQNAVIHRAYSTNNPDLRRDLALLYERVPGLDDTTDDERRLLGTVLRFFRECTDNRREEVSRLISDWFSEVEPKQPKPRVYEILREAVSVAREQNLYGGGLLRYATLLYRMRDGFQETEHLIRKPPEEQLLEILGDKDIGPAFHDVAVYEVATLLQRDSPVGPLSGQHEASAPPNETATEKRSKVG